jgi:hypothetical protein
VGLLLLLLLLLQRLLVEVLSLKVVLLRLVALRLLRCLTCSNALLFVALPSCTMHCLLYCCAHVCIVWYRQLLLHLVVPHSVLDYVFISCCCC